MNDNDLIRYSRHILLPDFGEAKQEVLRHSHAVIIGLGGLGCPSALYLAASGIAKLTLIDFDKVSLDNLQRQIAYIETDIDQSKALVLAKRVAALNSTIEVIACDKKLTTHELENIIGNVDVVLDCTDNFASRFAINKICVQKKVPLIAGAALRWQGQVMTFNFQDKSTACYACLFPETTPLDEEAEIRCAESAVLSPLVGIIGAMQALQTIKLLTHTKNFCASLTTFDGLENRWRTAKITKDPQCLVCNNRK